MHIIPKWDSMQKVVVEKLQGSHMNVPIGLIREPENPSRQTFEDIEALAETIKGHGLLQSLLVKRLEKGYGYEVVVGLRRLRACQKAKLETVPCVVLNGELSEDEILEMQLVENLQRRDLEAWEEIRLVRQLKDRFKFTNAEIGSKIGVSDSAVGDLLSVGEKLPEDIVKRIVKAKGGKSHPKDLSLSKAVILSRSGLPTEQIRELARLIHRIGYTREALTRKLARTHKSKLMRHASGRQFWHELTRNLKYKLKEFSEYWSDYCELKEWEDTKSFHLKFEIHLPKDLSEAES